MGRKFLSLFLALLSPVALVCAQMTDDKVYQYVLEQQEKGVSQQQIIFDLNKRGVTVEQLQRMRDKYEKTQSSGMLGNTKVLGKDGRIVRTRTASDEAMQRSTMNLLELDQTRIGVQRPTEQERLQMMYDESMYMFADSMYLLMESLKPHKEIYGHELFKSENMTFQPSLNIATPQNYKLGPGDEVIIDIWGASQQSIQETISPDGNIVVENLGPVYLNGLTVQQADRHIKDVFSEIYSDLSDSESDSHIKLSLGQNRSISVNVMGDVTNPGTYSVSSFATVFNALYMAGGVTEIGSLRSIKVYRQNREIATLDVYDYLINGRTSSDIRLEDNDVIVVPPISCLTVIDGRVRRPMYYEMKTSETVADLLAYAGGMSQDAYRKDVRLIRMGDVQRQIFTLDVESQKSFYLADGDSLFVDSIKSTYSNMVEVRGAVYRPGQFQTGQGIQTVRELIAAAGGLTADAFMGRALLNRMNPDRTLINQQLDLQAIIDGSAIDEQLRNGDVLFIPSLFDVREEPVFSIFGEVQFPGTYAFADSTHIEDLILQAGGLKESASIAKVDVVRRRVNKNSLTDTEEISTTYTFSISEGLNVSDETFVLLPFDEVYVRKSPGYSESQQVMVEGEVLFPGYYSISSKGEKLTDIIERAGGFTSEAYVEGARLQRTMTDDEKLRLKDLTKLLSGNDSTMLATVDLATSFYVGIDLQEAVDNPEDEGNTVMRDGDKIIVPKFTNTVKMNGEVMYSNTVAYSEGKTIKYYIDKAGGYGQNAKRNKVYIIYMNGTVAKANRYSGKLIQPGCEIVVPSKLDREGMTPQEILSLSSTSASLATVVLALINLLK